MQLKHVVALLLTGVIAGGLLLLKQYASEETAPAPAGETQPLMPRDFEPRRVRRLVVAAGYGPARRIVLEREGPNAPWRVASHYGARANQQQADGFLTALLQLGNRLEARPPLLRPLSFYGLTSEQALHVAARGEGGQLLFHLLAGAPDETGARFYLRRANQQTVFSSPVNLWAESELAPLGRPFSPAPWLDLDITDLRPHRIERIAFAGPGKELVIERTDTSAQGETDAPPWALASGGYGDAGLRPGGGQTLANHLARLTGVNAADPARLEELGLAPPMFTTELTLRGEDNPLRLVGGRPQGSEAGYVQIAGDSQVFVLESAPFEMAFGLGSALFDLPRLDLALSELTRLELQTPGYAASFEREGEAWILADPELDLPVSALTVNAAAGELATWAAADYAGEKAETGLDRAPWTAVAAYEGGARKLSVGGRSALVRGRYVRLNGAETPLVMRQSDVNLVFPPLRDLFDRRLAPLDAADVTRLEVAVGGAETSLTRAKEGWAWAGAPVSEETAAALLEAAAAWQANGVTLQPPSIENYPARITAQSAGGAERVIELSAPVDDVRFTRVNGGPPAYLVLEDAFQALLAALPRGPEPADTPEESNP